MKISIRIILFLFVIIIFSNLSFLNLGYNKILNLYNFQTKNNEFNFILLKEKGRDIELMNKKFELFKKENPETSDTIIFRVFERKPIKFWNWYKYLTDEIFKYPLLKEE